MSRSRPILYIKRGCPWCRQAKAFFDQNGVDIDVKDVERSPANMQRMIEISEQSLTPTLEFDDFVVADFSVNELLAELDERPDVRHKLGIGGGEDGEFP
ncbi:MAG: glutaredoxin family protein [Opitutales bacterium]